MTNNVLIVDDSQPMRELIKLTLIGVAEVVGECSDGAEAVSEYKRLRPDWVLMDYAMPGMDGLTATRQIITLDSKARILLVTQHDDEEIRQAAGEAGALMVLLKENLFTIPSKLI